MESNSVGALHVALAAAVVGWLVFTMSHSIAVWRKRNTKGNSAQRSWTLVYVALLLCVTGLVGGWLNRELTRRAGVILGTDFFVVRARARAIPHLTAEDSIRQGSRLAGFDDPEADREEGHLEGDIAVLEEKIANMRLQPLVLDPELLRLSQDASDSQRARLTQLGYGVLRPGQSASLAEPALGSVDLSAAERARSAAAQMQFERTAALIKEGVIPRDKLEASVALAQTAAQELRERQQLIEAARAGSASVAQAQSAITRDGGRAKAERAAELAELNANLTALEQSLLLLHQQGSVFAPFNGKVVYRQATPALATEGQVILALAKGTGFLATVQVPAREAGMLSPGQDLRLKLQHSLVSEEVSGRLQSVQTVAGDPDRRDLLIECDLPAEQFASFASGSIPVQLQWRPSLVSERLTQAGFALSLLSLIVWISMQLRKVATTTDQPRTLPSATSTASAKRDSEAFQRRLVHLTQANPLANVTPGHATAAKPVFTDLSNDEIDSVLARLDLSAQDLAEVSR